MTPGLTLTPVASAVDVFAESGTPFELYQKYGLDAVSIAEKIIDFYT